MLEWLNGTKGIRFAIEDGYMAARPFVEYPRHLGLGCAHVRDLYDRAQRECARDLGAMAEVRNGSVSHKDLVS